MTCRCDDRRFPEPVSIPAGLTAEAFRTARALGIFPDWRASVLAAIGAHPALDHWRARERHDLGLMLVDMGAYVFDVCDFYDALAAAESFLKTAQLSGAQRRLVALLGYLPRPAVAAEALLAAEAEGRRVVQLPVGTAFRSGAFDDEAPQVFELTAPAAIDPRINRFIVDRVPHDAIATSTMASLLVDPASVRLRAGDPVVLDFNGTLRPARVASLAPAPLRGRIPAARLTFTSAVSVPAGSTYSRLRILGSGGTRGLWKLGEIGGDTETAIAGSDILLGTVANVHAGDIVLFEYQGVLEARRVNSSIERQRTLFATLSSTIKDTSNVATGTVESAPVKVAISRLSLNAALTWSSSDAHRIVVHQPLGIAARPLTPVKDTLDDTDPVSIPGLVDPPRVNVSKVLLEDVHHEGVQTSGSLNVATRRLTLNQGEDWGRTLTAAVTLFGNVLSVSRGETVIGETLGAGDASLERQTFTLKKKPLTYLSAATASGVQSTLTVRVGGVLWRAVDSFYGATDVDRVYIVRHDEEGETYVTFGGGARLPTGAIVTADYRYGAGRAAPPAGSIVQLARPVPGLTSVKNVLPAFGGADAESPAALAVFAPRSALLLGRAISLADLEAAALVPGVRAARAMWRWDARGLRAVAQVQYIGASELRESIYARLHALSEPDAPISVVRSAPQPAALAIGLAIHPDYLASNVIAAVRDELYREADLPGSGGLLSAERLGPEGVVFLSHIAAAVMRVEGVAAMRSVTFDGTPFVQSGRKPAAGAYFDFGEPEPGSSRIVINGVA